MSNIPEDKETERFYSLSYFVIPIPMILGLAFAVYVLITEDSRNIAYCTVAKQENAYHQTILDEYAFEFRQAISLNLCKDKDDLLDDGDGQLTGRVHWFVCKGTVCGRGWETILAQP